MTREKPITIRGVTYESRAAAAKALGVSGPTVVSAFKRGTEDNVGKGIRQPLPVTIRGVEYPSAQVAAEALGVKRDTIYRARAENRLDQVGLGGAGTPRERVGKPVTIRGVEYRSMGEAAQALGVTRQAVHQAVKRGAEDRIGRGRQ